MFKKVLKHENYFNSNLIYNLPNIFKFIIAEFVTWND